MNTWIALLRSINVGGRNVVPMKDLRALLESLGYESVQTYIQSGNCVFRSGKADAAEIDGAIAGAIEDRFGFRPEVMTLSRDDIAAAVRDNPFPEAEADPKSLHFFFLARPAVAADTDALEALRAPSERYLLADRVFYLSAPDGIGRSKLAAGAEKKLGVETTARNYRSVLKLLELAS